MFTSDFKCPLKSFINSQFFVAVGLGSEEKPVAVRYILDFGFCFFFFLISA